MKRRLVTIKEAEIAELRKERDEAVADAKKVNRDYHKLGKENLANHRRAITAESEADGLREQVKVQSEDLTQFLQRLNGQWFLEQNWFPQSIIDEITKDARNLLENTHPISDEAVEKLAFRFQNIFAQYLYVDDNEIEGIGPASFACARAVLNYTKKFRMA